MNNKNAIDCFVRNPNLLIELCSEVVQIISQNANSQETATMETQLREIAKTIERLEKIGVAVPDSLRAEKTKLALELETKKESFLGLKLIAEGLDKLLRDIAVRTNHLPKRVVGAKRKKRSKSVEGLQTPRDEIKDCLVDSLRELGGYAHCSDVLDIMNQKLAEKFLPGDLESDKSFGVRWRHNAHWARLNLANNGILAKDSPRGYWKLNKE